MEKIILIIVVVLFISLLLVSILVFLSNKIKVSRYKIKSDKISKDFDGYKILQLSDLHNWNHTLEIVKIAYTVKPDIIVMTGDMINNKRKKYDNFIKLVNSLNKCKIIYVYGNHENLYDKKELKKIQKELDNLKVITLNNDKLTIFEEDSHINIYGLHYQNKYYNTKNKFNVTKKFIEEKIGIASKNEFNILLSHDPLKYDAYNEWGSDLTFSGHIHGGVVGISRHNGLLSPEHKFFPKYSSGINEVNNMNLVVSRGLGTNNKISFRLFNPLEIVVVELYSKK